MNLSPDMIRRMQEALSSATPSTNGVEPFPAAQVRHPLTSTPSSPPSEHASPIRRLQGSDLWEYLQLQMKLAEREAALRAMGQRLEAFGQIMKERYGFSDEELLDPDGVIVPRAAWQARLDQIRLEHSSHLDSASPDRDDHTGAGPASPS